MQANFNRTFLKELSSIPSRTRVKIEQLVFNDVPSYTSLIEISGIKKPEGYSHYYKICVGDYRIGVKIINDEISFERVLHPKEIYKQFP